MQQRWSECLPMMQCGNCVRIKVAFRHFFGVEGQPSFVILYWIFCIGLVTKSLHCLSQLATVLCTDLLKNWRGGCIVSLWHFVTFEYIGCGSWIKTLQLEKDSKIIKLMCLFVCLRYLMTSKSAIIIRYPIFGRKTKLKSGLALYCTHPFTYRMSEKTSPAKFWFL